VTREQLLEGVDALDADQREQLRAREREVLAQPRALALAQAHQLRL
jgi:hypothetical protein